MSENKKRTLCRLQSDFDRQHCPRHQVNLLVPMPQEMSQDPQVQMTQELDQENSPPLQEINLSDTELNRVKPELRDTLFTIIILQEQTKNRIKTLNEKIQDLSNKLEHLTLIKDVIMNPQ
ncbi:hypothetical protein BGZ49_000075 [Haplosporangium sp. Z 27]|nr:hypothetical protein BGZ49_000075 [Haplosporangium sp. Z 27]